MDRSWTKESVLLGALIAIGLVGLGVVLGGSLIKFREHERTVTAKGLAEREVRADIAIWPIEFVSAGDELGPLYSDLETNGNLIASFLREKGFAESEISIDEPSINDLEARGMQQITTRYSATQVVTVYSHDVDKVREAKKGLIQLGKSGVALSGEAYRNRTQYIYSGLNEIKPEMVEEATRKARVVAQKFAKDSDSKLGKIKSARQGQFSIRDRDSHNPHIKIVRVVNTVEYYLSD
jgi:hypothetical protein